MGLDEVQPGDFDLGDVLKMEVMLEIRNGGETAGEKSQGDALHALLKFPSGRRASHGLSGLPVIAS